MRKPEDTRSSNTSVPDNVVQQKKDDPLFPVIQWDIDPGPIGPDDFSWLYP